MAAKLLIRSSNRCAVLLIIPSPSAKLNVLTPSKPRQVGQRSLRRLGELRDENKWIKILNNKIFFTVSLPEWYISFARIILFFTDWGGCSLPPPPKPPRLVRWWTVTCTFYVDLNLYMQYILVMRTNSLINKCILLWYVHVLVSVSPFSKFFRAAQVTNLGGKKSIFALLLPLYASRIPCIPVLTHKLPGFCLGSFYKK